ncbi:MAG: potassium transporter [SAR86 cluster bacterium]|nr:MAG: potassium transporter [SAR86 cluster bacterium]|tara:strand:+ start:508 stop:1941 length:1434 start_codon:yes stop_codon:yes gene_type:complete
MNLKSVINLFSILILVFSFSFIFPILIAYFYSETNIYMFIKTFLIVSFTGGIGWILTRKNTKELNTKDGFIVITFFWLVLSLIGAIPFIFSGMNVVDSIFESMSGITTTGATTLVNLENLPKSILFYRQMLQWMGGMGLIVLAIAIMPLLGIGGGQLYKTEIPGAMKDQKLTPRIKETAQALWLIYLSLTVLCAILYYLAGMSLFDAISHSFSTVSIGGFSTHDESIGYFNSASIEIICMIFMLVSALSFTLHYFAIYLNKPLKYLKDAELRFFITVLLIIIAITLLISIFGSQNIINIGDILFHSVSIVTTTGFTSTDSASWPVSIGFILLIGAFIGACSGSVGGGIKSWRVLIMINYAYVNVMRLIHPNSVISLKIGSKTVEDGVANSVWGFFSIYVILFVCLLGALLVTGLDFESAFSAIGACLNNLGPGLGEVSQNYNSVSSVGKIILSFAMILGRLEIFTLLILLTPMFWQK